MTTTSPETDIHTLREENETLYGVIKLVSSSLELGPMLQGIVELATQATGCHACFIYLLSDDQLTIRAASPVFAEAVDRVGFPVTEGLTGWVARQRKPEFIRERALEDPRMKYVPLLEEERFQSMVAVPILSRAGETIGVIVLHTEAPREFGEDTLTLLVHIASLVSGAIENAQSYERERQRADALTGLSALSHQVAAAQQESRLAQVVTRGVHELVHAERCRFYRLQEESGAVELLAAAPAAAAAETVVNAAELLLDERVLTISLTTGGERIGLLCAQPPEGRRFSEQEQEVLRAVAHLAAVALKRLELIEGLTKANTVKDLFEALAAGATEFAAGKAAEVRCDMTKPYLLLSALPARGIEQASRAWRAAAEELARELAKLAPHTAIEPGPGPLRALLAYEVRRPERIEEVIGRCRELGLQHRAVVGLAEPQHTATEAGRAFREARDAVSIGSALLAEGGAITYAELGAYRYLVGISPADAPRDRVRAAVDKLIAYDLQRRTALLDTLERYLAERSCVIDSARVLYIHPNTLRQRLGRIEELTGLKLDEEDLLSLELAIKLSRLHGRPAP